mmetsp:Transcript_56/g.201  ORF Transcript_56/g.201 Transcript_56/m.201 type:complete len:180 (+) Transcript_56:521-1060(+)
MQKLSLRRLDAKQLLGFVLVLFDFRARGLALADEALEARLVQELCASVKAWPADRLGIELAPRGGLAVLCESWEPMQRAVASTLRERLSRGVGQIARTLRHPEDCKRIKDEIIQWGQLAKTAHAAGLFVLDDAARREMVDVLSDCTERCMASPKLIEGADQIRGAQMALLLSLGGLASG